MQRVIFDTNIYGKLIEEKNINSIRQNILKDKKFVIYGYTHIRKELRNTPKQLQLGKLKTRNILLNLYDELTKGRYLKDSIKIHEIAMKYYNAYRRFGGIRNWKLIGVDFTLVACASFYKLDLVVSDDSKTLLSKTAKKAYKHISIKEKRWNPNFWKYSDLRTAFTF